MPAKARSTPPGQMSLFDVGPPNEQLLTRWLSIITLSAERLRELRNSVNLEVPEVYATLRATEPPLTAGTRVRLLRPTAGNLSVIVADLGGRIHGKTGMSVSWNALTDYSGTP